LAYRLEGAPSRPEARHTPPRTPRPLQLHSARVRLRFALLSCLALIGFFSFVVFPPKQTTISADGTDVVVTHRKQELSLLLGVAKVYTQPGDVLVREGNDFKVGRAVPVLVEADGRAIQLRTRSTAVKDVLAEAGLSLGPHDTLLLHGREAPFDAVLDPAPPPPGQAAVLPPERPVLIGIRRAVPVTLNLDGDIRVLETSRQMVAEVLNDAGVKLGHADTVSPALASGITANLQIEVARARLVTLRAGSVSRQIYTHKSTLGEALAAAGFSLTGQDRVEPGLETPVTDGMSARLVRVEGRTYVEKETFAHKTVFRPDENLGGANTRVVPGNDGVKLREYRLVIEDGVEKSRELVREYWEPPLQDRVIYYPAANLHATGLNPANLELAATKRLYATWYNAASSGRPARDPNYGITRTGVPVTKGIVAVDPSVIPLGTRLYVPGYGFAVAADTGGGVKGDMIDLGYPDGVAVDWQTGWVEVYILK
jgi:uncharacterized protein YabE (DUF348 family)/3D (Asp-Asp-Asp) domain-containing protein